MNLYFTYESRGTLKSFTMFISVKAITKLNLGHIDKSEIIIIIIIIIIKILKISHPGSRSPDQT